MSTSLKNTLTGLATTFASNVLDAIRQMSLDELLAETQRGDSVGRPAGRAASSPREVAPRAGAPRSGRGRGGRLGRRSADDIAALVDRIVSILQASPNGLRAEQIRAELGLEAKELPRPLGEALDSGRISKSGQKRATTYFSKKGGGAGKVAAAPAGKGGKGKERTAARAKRGGGKKRSAKTRGKGGRKAGKRGSAGGGSASQQHGVTNGAAS
jgi:hypothetical protein